MTAKRKSSPDHASNLIADFQRYFQVEFASTPAQRAAVYGLRYRVYCLEEKFEPATRFPSGLETDEHDARSLHCLITHRSSGLHAGCVRVVSPGADNLLPFEQHCPSSIEPAFYQSRDVDLGSRCEISRLAVDGGFRRRFSDRSPGFMGLHNGPRFTREEARILPLIATAGFLAATALTDLSGQREVFALMEPHLPRLMRRVGYKFQRAGHDVDYNGTRAPYFIRTQWAIKDLRPELRELYDAIYSGLAGAYHAAITEPNSLGHGQLGDQWMPTEEVAPIPQHAAGANTY